MQHDNDSKELTLAEVARRWARWRRERGRGRIPNQLWQMAAQVAHSHGAERVANRLNVDARRLRKYLPPRDTAIQTPAEQPSQPLTFVELPPIPASSGDWNVELEMAGRILRVSSKGASANQILEVAQGLWRVTS